MLLATATTVPAQKKQLDHNVYDGWEHVGSNQISADGSTVVYEIAPQAGDGKLVVKNLTTGESLEIERGTSPSMSKDGRWCIFKIKAPYEATRKAKIAKKKADDMPKDTLAYIDLKDFHITRLTDASNQQVPQSGRTLIAYDGLKVKAAKKAAADSTKALKDSTMTAKLDTTAKAKADTAAKATAKKPAAKTEKTKVFVLLDPETGRSDTLSNVEKYSFSRTGDKLAVVFQKDKKDSLSKTKVSLFDIPEFKETVLDSCKRYYSTPTFNFDGDKLVFLASADSNATGNKHCAVILSELVTTGRGRKAVTTRETREIIPQSYTDGLPANMCVTENASPAFSRNSSRIFLGIAECIPPKDTTIIDFESAQLDIWNWDIYMTPPMQKANAARIKSATCKSVINLDEPGRIVPLTDNLMESIAIVDGGEADWALAVDHTPYLISSTWDSNSLSDVYFVSLKDGSRSCFRQRMDGSPSPSPKGGYLTWYDHSDHNWYSYSMTSGKTTNLTGSLDGTFFDDEDDHPMPKPGIDRPHWIEGDEEFLMAEKFDIWRFKADGSKAESLTKGEGRRSNTQYRVTFLRPADISKQESDMGIGRLIGRKDEVALTSYNRTTKENGFARINAAAPGLISSFTAPFGYSSYTQARNASTVAYLKGDASLPNDLFVSGDFFASETRLSSINPQQQDYNWCDVRLVHWNAYDGTPLDGLLYTPEDLDPSKSYPMIIYFYEKNSQNMYRYYQPVPSRSVINFSFYASRGYVVFVPDIVYKDGHPGESAYNCICSGAEAMCGQFPFIDKSRMGIQGQSWGGYQTAYLVTRTHMFAAAGAGAPVGNMTSAYGGIRWESGSVRAMQYEHGQSRIGKSLWDEGGLDLYIENSPVFHTQDVSTPVLIMHNDADGAVPWYQGIEFFMALRRFNHPAWLLQYNGEAHNLGQRRNAKDLSVRLQQFFDHYLKGEPMPAWMKTGVPVSRKGQYYGLETVSAGKNGPANHFAGPA